MAILDNAVLSVLKSQIPGFVIDSYPNFVAFIEAYYEWMENSEEGAALYHSKKLLDYKNVDETIDDFLEYFRKDFLPYFPADIALDERKLIKTAREFYSKKGSLESIKFLFRVLYNKEIEIFYPKEQVLRASDGKWNQPQSIKVILSAENENLDLDLLAKRQGIGSTSRAKCRIESANRSIDKFLNREVVELFISNITKSFKVGENLQILYYDVNDQPQTFSESIIGSLSSITITPNRTGLKYKENDPVVLVGGVSSTGIEAIAVVGDVSVGGLRGVSVVDGGFGFRDYPNTVTSVINSPGDSGTGANVVVSTLDYANTIYFRVNTDSIESIANSTIGAANLSFSNISGISNANSTLANAFSYANLAFAPLKTLNVVSGGSGFTGEPTLDFKVSYITNNIAQQYMDSLGHIGVLKILNGGGGYSPGNDKIIFSSTTGYGANAAFTVGSNGTINSISIISRGEGYYEMPPIYLANSSNTIAASNGTGAVIVAYGFGDAEETDISVDDAGRIKNIKLLTRGFDYRSTPTVSLRVQDLTTTAISEVLVEGDVVYQGTSYSTATYKANVDKYDAGTSTLRVYDYSGTVSAGTLVLPTTNTSVVSFIKYGNGQAKATAEFLSGVIKYPGFWSKSDGFLSWDQYLQDSEKYHNFSYEIVVDKALETYRNIIRDIIHPAGMSIIGDYVVSNEIEQSDYDNLRVGYGSLGQNTVNVVANTVTASGGTNTYFNVYATVNSYIVISPDTSREIVKRISNVVSNSILTLESSVAYIGNNKIRIVNSNSNVFVLATSTELLANDVLTYTNGSVINSALILSITGNVISTNTNGLANSDVYYSVTPRINTQSYRIISV